MTEAILVIDARDHGLPHAPKYYQTFPQEPSPLGLLTFTAQKTTAMSGDSSLFTALPELGKAGAGGAAVVVCHAYASGMLLPIAPGGAHQFADKQGLDVIDKAIKAEADHARILALPRTTDVQRTAALGQWRTFAHLRRGDRAALDHQIGRHAKERWGPEHEVGDPPGAPAFTGSAPAAAQARGQARPQPAKPSQTKLKRPPVEMWESGRAKPEALECGPLDLFPLLRHAPNCKRAGDGATLGRVKGVNNDAGRPVRFINAMTIMVCADCPKETVRCHFMCATAQP